MTTPTCNYQYPDWPEHIACPEPAWDDQGRCLFHSENSDKDVLEMVARVKDKLSRSEKDFTGYIFPAEVDFSGVDFGDRVSFKDATFGDGASFWGATFGQGAYFGGATFGDGASFWDATFGDGAYFGGVTFGKGARFWGATFGQGASFGGATFGDGAGFEGARFGDGADFRSATFDHAIFRRTAFSSARFQGAFGLDTCEFDSVTWGTEGSRQGVLGDEEVARESGKSADFAAAERVYREVRRSYLERRDFTMARQMHWGEMEMRRLKEAARRRESHKWLDRKGLRWLADISLTWVYWWLSGYGQRWGNALVSLTALWLVCALGYTAETLSVANPAPAFAEALMNGVSQSLFSLILRPIYTPATLGGLLINFLQMVLSPIVITTLVLAVREQFRH